MQVNESSENYLETILVLSKRNPVVRSVDIAEELGFKKSSVSVAMKNLREKNNITVTKEGYIYLTDSGREIAEMIYERHELLTDWLTRLGVDPKIAADDACRMEHVISEETVQQICNFVDYGDTFERILKQPDLRSWYRPGSYQFLMGIYQIEKTYPRRFAREFKRFSENIRLHVTEDESSFELIKREGEASSQNLWYKDQEQGWIQAEE